MDLNDAKDFRANAQAKSYSTTFWLSLLFGILGVDHFYLRKWNTGILKALTVGGFGFWYLYDLYELYIGVTRDKDAQKLAGFSQKKRNLFVGFAILWFIWVPTSFGIANSLPSPTPLAESSPRSSFSAVSESCVNILEDIVAVRGTFQSSGNSVSDASKALIQASSSWEMEATNFSGSKSEWLRKMAELSTAVNSFLLTGTPYDGELKFDQLQNNMNLYDQFCN